MNVFMKTLTSLGGVKGVRYIIDAFFKKVTSNEILLPYFKGYDLDKLHSHHEVFLLSALAFGEGHSEKLDLKRAHTELVKKGLSDVQYDELSRVVFEVLAESEHEIPGEIRDRIKVYLDANRDAVLNRGEYS